MKVVNFLQQLSGHWHGSQGVVTPLGILPVIKAHNRRALHTDSRCKQLPRRTGRADHRVQDFTSLAPGRLCTHCSLRLAELLTASRVPSHPTQDAYVVVYGQHQPWLRRGPVQASNTKGLTDNSFYLVRLTSPVRCALLQHAPTWMLATGPAPVATDTPAICELALGLWEPPPSWPTSELTQLTTAFAAARSLLV